VKTKTFEVVFILMMIVTLLCSPSSGQTVLLEENWDSGTIDGGKWTVSNPAGTVVQLEDLGSGDFAIYTMVTDELAATQANFYSADTFSRGNDIYCEFLAWGNPDNAFDGWNTQFGAVPGSGFPHQSQIAGPWRQNDSDADHYLTNQEACISHYVFRLQNWDDGNFPGGSPNKGIGLYRYDEDEYNSGPAPSINYVINFQNAREKSKAILHRVYLDDTQGSRFQWSNDGGATWNLEVDSRGTSGGTQASGLHVGFGAYAVAVFIDDIRVVTGDGSPSIPILPGSQPGVPLLDENWDSGVFDPSEWAVSLEFESQFETGMTIGVEEFDPVGFPGNFSMHAKGQDMSLAGSAHHTAFFHALPFPRGENLVCEFTFWRDLNETGWAGSVCQSYGIHGPFHKNKHDLLFNPEAMIRYFIPWTPTQGQEFAQPGDPWTTSPKLTQGYHNFFCNAASRELAVTVEVLLGNTNGARIRWNSPGQFQSAFLTEYDTRGVPPNIGHTSSTNPYIGFGTFSGKMFWDDILLTNDQSSGPTNTPTIAPTSTPTTIVAGVENWEDLE